MEIRFYRKIQKIQKDTKNILHAGYKTFLFSCSAQNLSVILFRIIHAVGFRIIHAVGFLFCTLLHDRICKSSLTICRGLCLFADGSLFKSQFLWGASSSSIGYVDQRMTRLSSYNWNIFAPLLKLHEHMVSLTTI